MVDVDDTCSDQQQACARHVVVHGLAELIGVHLLAKVHEGVSKLDMTVEVVA